jgi:hypothetical protein
VTSTAATRGSTRCLGSLFLGRKDVARYQRDTSADILLLDLGLHKIPYEILKIAEWFAGIVPFRVLAYEAHPDYLAESREALKMSGMLKVRKYQSIRLGWYAGDVRTWSNP